MKKIILLALISALVACSNPHSTVLSTAEADNEKMQESMMKITEDERKLVLGYMMRTMMAGAFSGKKAELPVGVTIGDAIKLQEAWLGEQKIQKAEAEALKEKLLAEQEAAEKIMNEAVTVTLISKKILPEHGRSGIVLDEHIQATVGYHNKSDKPIAGVKGRLSISDIFGKEITAFIIANDADIDPGKTVTWAGGRSVKYGSNSNGDRQFSDLPDEKFKVDWKPEIIVFKDGTVLKSKE